MPPSKKPLLMRSPLTGRVYIVTRYRSYGPGADGTLMFDAQEKHDVTEEFLRLAAEVAAESAPTGADGV